MSINLPRKFLQIPFLALSFLVILTACEGKRDIRSLPDTDEAEVEEPITLSVGAVKGPLVGVDIGVYTVDFNSGRLGDFNRLSLAFFEMLSFSGLSVDETGLVSAPISRDSSLGGFCHGAISGASNGVEAWKNQFSCLETYFELDKLKSVIDDSTSLSSASVAVDEFLQNSTNTYSTRLVANATESFSSLNELKGIFTNLSTLSDLLREAVSDETGQKSFSGISSAISLFRGGEQDAIKRSHWEQLEDYYELAKNSATSASAIERQVKQLEESLREQLAQSDPVASQQLDDLIEQLESTSDLLDSIKYLDRAFRKEGYEPLRLELGRLLNGLSYPSKAADLLIGRSNLYVLGDLAGLVSGLNSISELNDQVLSVIELEQQTAFSEALKVPNEQFSSLPPTNRIAFESSDNTVLVSDVELQDFEGLVYIEAVVKDGSVDLNSGQSPVVSILRSFFHTHSILGFGDNTAENVRVVYRNGDVFLRDENGEFVRDLESFEGETEGFVEQLPQRYASPLSELGFSVALLDFGKLHSLTSDWNLDGSPDYRLSSSSVDLRLKSISDLLFDSLSVTQLGTAPNVFDAPMLMTGNQYGIEDAQRNYLSARYASENFAAAVAGLASQLNVDFEIVVAALARDILDGEFDAKEYDTAIPLLVGADDIAFRLTRSPSSNVIAGTSDPVDQLDDLLLSESSFLNAAFVPNDFVIQPNALALSAPVGGVDSDGDGVLDNSDAFPNDANSSTSFDPGFAGVWSVNVDSQDPWIMPFSGQGQFDVAVQVQSDGGCLDAPCIAVGSLDSITNIDWRVVDVPEFGELEIGSTSQSTGNFSVGFLASVPGDYLAIGDITSSESAPGSPSRVVLPIRVLDFSRLSFGLSQSSTRPGETPQINLVVDSDICEALEIEDSLCIGLNFEDSENDFIDISQLPDVFGIQWGSRQGNGNGINAVRLSEGDTAVLDFRNTGLGQSIEATISLRGSSEFVIAQLESPLAINTSDVNGQTIPDSDGDGVADSVDAFPYDGRCSNLEDGITDTDRSLASVQFPFCIDTVLERATSQEYLLADIGERWIVAEGFPFVFRKNASDQTNLAPIFLGYDSPLPMNIIDDFESRFVFMAMDDSSVKRFDVATQSLADILPSKAALSIDMIAANSGVLMVRFVDDADLFVEMVLSDFDGQPLTFASDSLTPAPGEMVRVSLIGLSSSNLPSAFSVSWELFRPGESSVEPVVEPGGRAIAGGQTVLGDILLARLSFEGQQVAEARAAVLGLSDISLNQAFYSANDVVSLSAESNETYFSVLSSRLPQEGNLRATWLIDDDDPTVSKFEVAATAEVYPFGLPASLTETGDIVQGSFVYEIEGSEVVTIGSYLTLIIGNPNAFDISVNTTSQFDIKDRDDDGDVITVDILGLSETPEFFTRFFTPVWLVNGLRFDGESSLTFPSQGDRTRDKIGYGSEIIFSYEYAYGEQVGGGVPRESWIATPQALSAESYTVVPPVSDPGTNIGVDVNELQPDFLDDFVVFPEWFINGELASSELLLTQSSLEIATSSLEVGDHVALEIYRQDIRDTSPELLEDALVFTTGAEVVIGYDRRISKPASPNDIQISALENVELLPRDADGDGFANDGDYMRNDSACYLEQDGIPDDSDLDGISDLDELEFGTGTLRDRIFINEPDSDKDGFTDFEEMNAEIPSSPSDPNSIPVGADDRDRDGLSDAEELAWGTGVDVRDSDGDGLSDGLEVSLSCLLGQDTLPTNLRLACTRSEFLARRDLDGFRDSKIGPFARNSDGYIFYPLEADSDGNGISDGEEYESELSRSSSLVAPGTCFASHIGAIESDALLVKPSELPQSATSSEQRVVFAEKGSKELFIWNAVSRQFEEPLKSVALPIRDASTSLDRVGIQSVAFEADSAQIVWIGDSAGRVYRLDLAQPNVLFEETPSTLRDTSIQANVTGILDQGNTLIVETTSAEGDRVWTLFPDTGLAESVDSPVSLSTVVRGSDPARQLFGLDDVNNQLYRADINASGNAAIFTRLSNDSQNLVGPVSYREIGGNAIALGDGVSFDPVTGAQSVSDRFIIDYEAGLSRLTLGSSLSSLSLLSALDLGGDDRWNVEFSREGRLGDTPIAIFESGEDLVLLERSVTASKSQLNLTVYRTGDADQDGLPDWWEQFASDAETGDLDPTQLFDGARTYLQAYQDGVEVSSYSMDQDSDGVVDALENCELCVAQADQDFDGVLDGDELILGTQVDNPDSDGNGVVDGLESEDNLSGDASDALTVVEELYSGRELFGFATDPLLNDTDGDGLSDADEIKIFDFNGDGVSDEARWVELCVSTSDDFEVHPNCLNASTFDSDGDGTSDGQEDADGDSLSNAAEMLAGTDPLNPDSDADGLTDAEELDTTNGRTATNPLNADSDGDGIPDKTEENNVSLDPNNPADSALDSDGDGLSNLEEVLFGSAIDIQDTDADGLSDLEERDGRASFTLVLNRESLNPASIPVCLLEVSVSFAGGTNPRLADTDGDGCADQDELQGLGCSGAFASVNRFVTNPVQFDSDLDGLSDSQEQSFGSDPTLANSEALLRFPEELSEQEARDYVARVYGDVALYDDVLAACQTQSVDQLNDFEEFNYATNFEFSDSLAPRLPEGSLPPFSNPLLSDTDGDGLLDHEELQAKTLISLADSDYDGLTDFEEQALSTDPLNIDSDQDNLLDGQEVDILSTNPLDLDSDDNGVNDDLEDFDRDQMTNWQELNITFTDPLEEDGNGYIQFSGGDLKVRIHPELDVTLIAFEDMSTFFFGANASLSFIESQDGERIYSEGDLLVLASDGTMDASADPDLDNLSMLEELALGTDPYRFDTDSDGIADGDEVSRGTSPVLEDSDGDTLSDFAEINEFGTDPTRSDTDSDGLPDNIEVEPSSKSDPLLYDSDGDFLKDSDEGGSFGDADIADTDGDGILDGIERLIGTLASSTDSDVDLLGDATEVWVFAERLPGADVNGDGESNGDDQTLIDTVNSRSSIGGWLQDLTGFDSAAFLSNASSIGGIFTTHEVLPLNREFPILDPISGEFLEHGTEQVGILYVRRISDPTLQDTDQDGLSDYVELVELEGNRTDYSVCGTDQAVDRLCSIAPVEGSVPTDPRVNLVIDISDDNAVFDPELPNASLYRISDPANVQTQEIDGSLIEDAQADFDRDRLVNLLDVNANLGAVATNNIIAANSDLDFADSLLGLLDGFEAIVLLSDQNELDSDNDGLSDLDELVARGDWSLATESQRDSASEVCRFNDRYIECLGNEGGTFAERCPFDEAVFAADERYDIQTAEITGVEGSNYCYMYAFDTIPTLDDSDRDGVSDTLDSYPRDITCSNIQDGFESGAVMAQCYSSWLAEQASSLDVATFTAGDYNEFSFFAPGLNRIVRYSEQLGSYLDEVSNTEAASFIAYAEAPNRLYVVNGDGRVQYRDAAATAMTLQDLPSVAGVINGVAGAGSALLVSVNGIGGDNIEIIRSDGSRGTTLTGTAFDLGKVAWDENTSRLYGFVGGTQLGYLSVVGGEIVEEGVFDPEFDSTVVAGDITLGIDGSKVLLSNGQSITVLSADPQMIGVIEDLNVSLGDKQYGQFDQLLEFSEIRSIANSGANVSINNSVHQLIGSVAIDPQTQNIDATRLPNAVVLNERSRDSEAETLSGLSIDVSLERDCPVQDETIPRNQLLLDDQAEDSTLLRLALVGDRPNQRVIVVRKNPGSISYDQLGLFDADRDCINRIWEETYRLDDDPVSGADDAFEDPDQDFLTNLEEFRFGTNPRVDDTDGDGVIDSVEFTRDTDALDPNDF